MSAPLSRRKFVRQLTAVGGLALLGGCGGSVIRAPQPKLRRIGCLSGNTSSSVLRNIELYRQTLRELGYAEDRDFVIVVRISEGQADPPPAMAAELLALPVDVLIAEAALATLAAKQATSTIPIVFCLVADPLGHITGVSAAPSLGPKQLEYLVATVPGLRRVAMLSNPNNAGAVLQLRDAQQAALTLGLDLQVFEVRTPDELDIALDAIARWRPDALQMGVGFGQVRDLAQIPDFAAKLRLPQIYTTDAAFVRAGGLMALGSNMPSVARIAAQLVDKIFRGSKPGDLPVALPTQLDFIINLSAAERIGLTIPDNILRLATEVIR